MALLVAKFLLAPSCVVAVSLAGRGSFIESAPLVRRGLDDVGSDPHPNGTEPARGAP